MRTQALLGALLVALPAALVVPAVAAAETNWQVSDQLEPTIVVEAASSAPIESSTTLVAGREYGIAVNGYYFEKIPTTDGGTFTYTYDGVYCFEGSTPTSVCSRETPRLFDGAGLRARIGGSGNFNDFYRLGAFSGVPAFKQGNNYSYDFTPATTGKLNMTIARDLRDTYSGALRVTLYGPPSPGATGPPGSGPSPDLHDLLNSACTGAGAGSPLFKAPHRFELRAVLTPPAFCPQLPLRTPRWSQPSALPSLEPGDEAIVLSPALSANQREATITLNTSTGDVAVALTEDDAKYRRYARRSCVIASDLQSGRDLAKDGLLSAIDTSLSAGAFTELAGLAAYLLPCLKAVDDELAAKNRAARSATGASVLARTAATGCSMLVLPIKVGAGSDLSSVRIRVRRSYPRPNVLRVSCSKTRTGVVVRVRSRRSGVKLRQLVGKRLSVGLLRPARAKGTARGTITFRR